MILPLSGQGFQSNTLIYYHTDIMVLNLLGLKGAAKIFLILPWSLENSIVPGHFIGLNHAK